MKKMSVVVLSVILVISLIGNVVLLMKLGDKESNSELESAYDLNSVPFEIIGIWEANAGRKVEIFEDGKVYWTYNASGAIYTGYIGIIDGYSIVLSQEYEGYGIGNYQSMSEVSKEELKDTHIIYEITMHGEKAFSAQNVDSREYAWSFIKSKQSE